MPPEKKLPRWLPGALISLLLIVAILYFVDLKQVAAALRRANYYILLAALMISFGWLAVRGIVWHTLLQNRAPYRAVFLSLSEGYLMNNFLPFRLGEFGRAFMLSRKSRLGFVEILPTIVIERIVDLAISAALLLVGVLFVTQAQGAERIALLVGGIVLAGLIALYILAHNRSQALQTYQRLSQRLPFLNRLDGFLDSFFKGLAVLTDSRWFVRFIFWIIVNWGMAICQFYLIVLAFFPHARPFWGIFGLGAAAFGGAVPSLPGAVGTFEGALGGALSLVSRDESTSLAAALTAHLFNYLVSGTIGIYALSREGETLAGIYRQLINLRTKKDAA